MGYTHYWSGTLTKSEELFAEIRLLFSVASCRVAGPSGEGEPVFERNIIAFNGAEQEGSHESAVLNFGQNIRFDFCKTARKPYDAVVGAVLLRCAFHNPGFNIRSDGSWDEWSEARDLYQQAFGMDAQMPEEMGPEY
ncbi:hypothetical protein ABW20_dc0101065 [Dactylellina cionopaga]|nr:hypothetical protein ABW20_dc0101065 [Dactylellina cionopaga]